MTDARCPDCGRDVAAPYGYFVHHTRRVGWGNKPCPGSKRRVSRAQQESKGKGL